MNATIREICEKSPRLKEVDYNSFKKEIGAIEIHGMEKYFHSMIDGKIKVSNNCNSIVAYLLNLTDFKPNGSLEWKGGSNPDIDVDVQQDRREEVIGHLKEVYGYDRVANIGTYGRFFAKSSIRKVGKALGYEIPFVDSVAKLVPDLVQGRNYTVEEALRASSKFQEAYDNDIRIQDIVRWASRLDGVIDSRGQHAAGIVIANEDIKNVASLWQRDGSSILEFTGEEVEKLGFVKMDLLGLATLGIIKRCLEFIKERRGIDVNIDSSDILKDKKTFDLLCSGNLVGVFQFESDGMSRFTSTLKPAKFSDVYLLSAAYRPGPLKFLPSIVAIKNGRTPELKSHAERFPVLKDILEETYGFFIYQEQIMKVVQLLAGYTDIEADEFRKIIGKKIVAKLPKEKERFSFKAKEKGLHSEEIEELWKEMEDFASYSFNKSHSVAYSQISMQTAYLKANYPAEFYTANIFYEIENKDQIAKLINESSKFGIKILPPDVNESLHSFTIVNDDTIRFGIAGIGGVGMLVASQIIKERNKSGKFLNMTDFIVRTNPKSNVIKSMINAGCFDSMGKRAEFLSLYNDENSYIDTLLETIRHYQLKEWFFNSKEDIIKRPIVPEYNKKSLAELEYQATGLWLSTNLRELYGSQIRAFKSKNSSAIIGFVTNAKMFKNKQGVFFSVEGHSLKFFVFKRTYSKLKEYINFNKIVDNLVGVVGFKSENEKEMFIVNDLKVFNSLKDETLPRVSDIPLSQDSLSLIRKKNIIDSSTNSYLQLNLIGSNYSRKITVGYIDDN